MTARRFIFISLLLFPAMVNSQQPKTSSGKFIVQDIQLVEIVDDVPPPPSNLTSKFKTLQDWLINICDSKKPRKAIQRYSFGLFESADKKVLYLVGQNTYTKEKSSSERTEFMPPNMYFLLQKGEYDSLTHEQIADILFPDLKEFTNT